MSDVRHLIGVDCLPAGYRVAELHDNGGRPEIVGLHRPASGESPPLKEAGTVTVGATVPDDLVIVKHLALGASPTDRRERALFELVQSLTGPERDYLLDVEETPLEGSALGIAVRRDKLHERIIGPILAWGESFSAARARMRALALGFGYRRFAGNRPGGVIVVADFDGARVSWCVLQDSDPVSVGYLQAARFDQDDPDDCRRLTAELRTSLDFRLAMLFDRGLTRPPVALAVTESRFSEAALEQLTEAFPIPVQRARVHDGYITPSLREQGVDTDGFFPALGIAANFLA